MAQRIRRLQTDWRRGASSPLADELDEETAADGPGAPREAIRALARQGDGDAVERLSPGVRRLAIGALAGIDTPLARELVEAALQ